MGRRLTHWNFFNVVRAGTHSGQTRPRAAFDGTVRTSAQGSWVGPRRQAPGADAGVSRREIAASESRPSKGNRTNHGNPEIGAGIGIVAPPVPLRSGAQPPPHASGKQPSPAS